MSSAVDTIKTQLTQQENLQNETEKQYSCTSHNVEAVNKTTQLSEDELFDLAAPPLHKPVIARLLPLSTHVQGIDLYQDDSSVILGRSKELTPPYRLQVSAKISAKHCEFHVDANSLTLSLRDLSSNGTFVNGQRLVKKKWIILKDKDHIALTRPVITYETNEVITDTLNNKSVDNNNQTNNSIINEQNKERKITVSDEDKRIAEKEYRNVSLEQEHHEISLKLSTSSIKEANLNNHTKSNVGFTATNEIVLTSWKQISGIGEKMENNNNNNNNSNNTSVTDKKIAIEFIVHILVKDNLVISATEKSEHLCSMCKRASEYMYMHLTCQHICCKKCKDNNTEKNIVKKKLDSKEDNTSYTQERCPKCNSLTTEELNVNTNFSKQNELKINKNHINYNVCEWTNQTTNEYFNETKQEEFEDFTREKELHTKQVKPIKRQREDDRDSYNTNNSFGSRLDISNVSDEDGREVLSNTNKHQVRHNALHYYNTVGKFFALHKLDECIVRKVNINLTKHCIECKTASTYDKFKCARGQSHLICHTCRRQFPERPFCERKQRCELCNTPYCNLYYMHENNNQSQETLCKKELMELKSHEVTKLPTESFAGNVYEQRKFLKFIKKENGTIRGSWKEYLQELSQHKTAGQVSANLNMKEITLESIVCTECAKKLFASFLISQGTLLNSKMKTYEKLQRPNCWNGLQCDRQYESLKHARQYNHVCLQMKRKE